MTKKIIGRPPVTGLYSWVSSKKLPRGRSFQKVRRELSELRQRLIDEQGGPDISASALILVDNVIEALGVQKLLGLHLRHRGVLDEQALKAGRLELSPVLSRNWIAFGNMVRQGVLALREIETKRPEPGPTLIDIIGKYSRGSGEEEPGSEQAAAGGDGQGENSEAGKG